MRLQINWKTARSGRSSQRCPKRAGPSIHSKIDRSSRALRRWRPCVAPLLGTICANRQIGNLIQKLKDTKSRIRDGMDLAKDAACHMEEASPDDEVSTIVFEAAANAVAHRRWSGNLRRCSRVGSTSCGS